MTLSSRITGEGPTFTPEALFWLSPEGLILATTLGRPGEVAREAGLQLQEAIERPMVAAAPPPTRVRVASAELADAVRAVFPDLEVRVAPTPEIEAAGANLRRHLSSDAATNATYLTAGIQPHAMAALFRAAAAFHRLKPWKLVPDDECLLFVTCEALGIDGWVVSIVGQAGETFGFISFPSLEAFETFLSAGELLDEEMEAPPVSHLALTFEKRSALPRKMVREITTHGWETAGPAATPLLGPADEEGPCEPDPDDVVVLETLTLALTAAFRDPKGLRAAWDRGDEWHRTFTLAGLHGDVAVQVAAARLDFDEAPADELLAAFHALTLDEDDVADERARRRLEAELDRRFLGSSEAAAAGVTRTHWLHLVHDLAARHFGATVATLVAPDLQRIVFDLVPRSVVVSPTEAGAIVAELRAAYAYLGRAHGLDDAEACLRLFGPDAEARLRAALSDSSNFGPGKAVLSRGTDAGFDMSTRAGVEAYMRTVSGDPSASRRSSGASSQGASSQGASSNGASRNESASKNQKKKERQARRKGR